MCLSIRHVYLFFILRSLRIRAIHGLPGTPVRISDPACHLIREPIVFLCTIAVNLAVQGWLPGPTFKAVGARPWEDTQEGVV